MNDKLKEFLNSKCCVKITLNDFCCLDEFQETVEVKFSSGHSLNDHYIKSLVEDKDVIYVYCKYGKIFYQTLQTFECKRRVYSMTEFLEYNNFELNDNEIMSVLNG